MAPGIIQFRETNPIAFSEQHTFVNLRLPDWGRVASHAVDKLARQPQLPACLQLLLSTTPMHELFSIKRFKIVYICMSMCQLQDDIRMGFSARLCATHQGSTGSETPWGLSSSSLPAQGQQGAAPDIFAHQYFEACSGARPPAGRVPTGGSP